MEPAFGSLDGVWPLTVLHLHNGMVVAGVDNLLFLDLGIRDVVNKSPTNATSVASVDESILRTGVEGILAIDKFGMQHHIALLALRLQIVKPLPVHQVLGACNGSRRCGGTEVTGVRVVVALCAEHAVDPPILMSSEAHIIDIGGRKDIVGHSDGLWPETEMVDTVGTLGHCEETLAVGPLNTYDKHIFAIPFDGTAVECCVHHDTLHQERIVLLVEVITPLQGGMFCCQDRILPLLIDTIIVAYGFVFSVEQFLVTCTESGNFVFKFLRHSFITFLMIYLFQFQGQFSNLPSCLRQRLHTPPKGTKGYRIT